MTTARSSGAGDARRRPSARSSRPPRPATTGASSSTSSSSDELVEAGRVGRPHGLDGTFHVLTRDPDLIADVLTVAGVRRAVVRRAGTGERPLVRLEGVESREAADALRGEPLWAARPPLGEDEYWAEDLVGCEIVGVGRVVRMLSYPSCEVLETAGGSMVPLVSDAIESIDLEARRIRLRQGFLDSPEGAE